MKLQLFYGNGVLNLPAATLAHVSRAEKRDLQVLLALSAALPTAASDDGSKRRRGSGGRGAAPFYQARRGRGLRGLLERHGRACHRG